LAKRRALQHRPLKILQGRRRVKDTDQLGTGDLMNAVRVLQRAEDFVSAQT
jgi:hypothetical protein